MLLLLLYIKYFAPPISFYFATFFICTVATRKSLLHLLV